MVDHFISCLLSSTFFILKVMHMQSSLLKETIYFSDIELKWLNDLTWGLQSSKFPSGLSLSVVIFMVYLSYYNIPWKNHFFSELTCLSSATCYHPQLGWCVCDVILELPQYSLQHSEIWYSYPDFSFTVDCTRSGVQVHSCVFCLKTARHWSVSTSNLYSNTFNYIYRILLWLFMLSINIIFCTPKHPKDIYPMSCLVHCVYNIHTLLR